MAPGTIFYKHKHLGGVIDCFLLLQVRPRRSPHPAHSAFPAILSHPRTLPRRPRPKNKGGRHSSFATSRLFAHANDHPPGTHFSLQKKKPSILTITISQVKRVAENMNERRKETEKRVEVRVLERQLRGSPIKLVNSGRVVVKELTVAYINAQGDRCLR